MVSGALVVGDTLVVVFTEVDPTEVNSNQV